MEILFLINSLLSKFYKKDMTFDNKPEDSCYITIDL